MVYYNQNMTVQVYG